MNYKHKKGIIKESAIKALVTDPLFKPRIEKVKKGKGSYSRKDKNQKVKSLMNNLIKDKKSEMWDGND